MRIRLLSLLIVLAAAALPLAAQVSQPAPLSASPDGRRADAYFYFAMARYYEEQYEENGRTEDANLAIEHYKQAYALDPGTALLGEHLAEMYYKAQRIRDAVLELQDLISRDPRNVSARKLLARIYVRSISDRSSSVGSRDIVGRAIEQYREIVRLDPADVESASRLARLLRLQGEDLQAERVLREALGRSTENDSVVQQLSRLLLESGRGNEAADLLSQQAERNPSAETFVLLGDAAQQIRDGVRAEAAYRRAIDLQPREPEPRRKLVEALISQNKTEAAIAEIRLLIEMEPGEAQNYLRLSQVYRRAGNLDQAEESLLQARQRAPGSLEVLYNEALLYEDQGRFDDAIRVLSAAVSTMKSTPAGVGSGRRTLVMLYEQLGRLYREVENHAAAVATFREMISLDRSSERRARVFIADTYREAKEIDKAVEECRKALADFPNDRGLMTSLALMLGERGEVAEAEKLLRSLLEGGLPDREILIALAQLYDRGRQPAAAEKSLQQAAKLAQSPAENEGVWLLLGAVYEREKKLDRAEAEFKRVLEINPKNSQALNYLGYMLAEAGIRLDEAESLVKRALEEEPYNGAYLDSLGWVYFRAGRLDEAEVFLKRAAARVKRDPTILEHLGDLYQRMGRAEAAAAAWEHSLSEWQRALPAEREPDRVAAIENKLGALKKRLAHKTAGQTKP